MRNFNAKSQIQDDHHSNHFASHGNWRTSFQLLKILFSGGTFFLFGLTLIKNNNYHDIYISKTWHLAANREVCSISFIFGLAATIFNVPRVTSNLSKRARSASLVYLTRFKITSRMEECCLKYKSRGKFKIWVFIKKSVTQILLGNILSIY